MSSGQGTESTRKQRRDEARAQRRAAEEAQQAAAQRRRRLTQLGGLAAVVVVIVVVIALATGGSKSPPPASSKQANTAQTTVNSMLAGIPQSGNVLGSPKAPYTMQYFGDLECPYCAQFTVNVLPSIIKEFVRPGTLKIEYHSMETATREPATFQKQQVAALAAGKQNKMWHYVELFYHEQGEEDSGYVTESFLQNLASQVPGLNLPQWQAARGEKSLVAQLSKDAQTVAEKGFEGTPSFLIGKTGGQLSELRIPTWEDPTPYIEEIKKITSS